LVRKPWMNGQVMIEEVPEEQLLLAHVGILKELPQSELEYLAKRSPIVRLAKKESLTLGEYRRGVLYSADACGLTSRPSEART
jgi:hypothetical protein